MILSVSCSNAGEGGKKSHQECQKVLFVERKVVSDMTVLWCVDALVHSVSAQRSDSCGDMFSLRPLWREERQSPEGRTCNFSFVGESISLRQRKQTISGTGSALSLIVFFSITDSEKLRQLWSHRHAGGHIRIFWWKSRLSGLKSRLSSEEDLLLLTGVRRDF